MVLIFSSLSVFNIEDLNVHKQINCHASLNAATIFLLGGVSVFCFCIGIYGVFSGENEQF